MKHSQEQAPETWGSRTRSSLWHRCSVETGTSPPPPQSYHRTLHLNSFSSSRTPSHNTQSNTLLPLRVFDLTSPTVHKRNHSQCASLTLHFHKLKRRTPRNSTLKKSKQIAEISDSHHRQSFCEALKLNASQMCRRQPNLNPAIGVFGLEIEVGNKNCGFLSHHSTKEAPVRLRDGSRHARKGRLSDGADAWRPSTH